MTIAHCPKCREQVTVPGGASRQARVRCPLCSEEYLLDHALQSLPPLLVVIHDPQASAADVDSVAPTRLPPAYGQESLTMAPAIVMESDSDELSFEPHSPVVAPAFKFESPAIPTARSASSSGSSRRPRTKRKQAGPVRFLVQTVGGGILGLAIAQLILWWMPGKWHPNNRDPFQMAAKVAPYAPFLVPADLRGGGPIAEVDSAPIAKSKSPLDFPDVKLNPDASVEAVNRNNAQNKKNKELPRTAATPEEFPLIGVNESDATGKKPGKELNPGATPDLTIDSPQTNPLDGANNGNPPGVVPASAVAAKSMPNETPGLLNPPQFNVDEISTRLADVITADLAWDTAENPSYERKVELITEIYSKLAKLGDAVAVIGIAQPEAAISLQPVELKLTNLAAQRDKLLPIGRFAGIWVTEHHDEGAVLVGTVLAHQQRGKLFETQVRLNAKSNPVVSVVSATNLSTQLPVQSNAVILGRLVSAPDKNLVGYEGNASSVMLYGLHAAIPAENAQQR